MSNSANASIKNTSVQKSTATNMPAAISGSASVNTNDLLLVMDVVDQMRHDQMFLDEKLSQMHSDEQIKENLKKVYAQNGITVTDVLLDQALVAYRKNEFALPKVPDSWQKKVALWYVTRAQWGKKALMGAAAMGFGAVFLAVLFHVTMVLPERSKLEDQAQALNQTNIEWSTKTAQLPVRLQDAQVKLQTLRPGVLTQSYVQTQKDTLLLQVQTLLEQVQNLPNLETVALTGAQMQDDPMGWQKLQEQRTQSAKVHQEMHQNATEVLAKVSSLSNLVLLEQRYGALPKNVLEQTAAGKALMVQLEGALKSAQIDTAAQQMQKADALVKDALRWEQLAVQERALMQEAKNVSGTAAAQIAQQLEVLARERQNGNLGAFEQQLALVQNMLNEVQLDLTYTIVSRQGYKSGVERFANDAPNAKRYYLIVEALDASGRAQNVRIKNIETGQMETVAMFGVEVSKNTFEQLKRDKQDDGIIQNVVVAKKPKGQLELKALMDVQEGRISKW